MTKTKSTVFAALTAVMLSAAIAPAMAAQTGGGGGGGSGGAAGGASGADGAVVSPNYDLIATNGCVTVRWLQTCTASPAR